MEPWKQIQKLRKEGALEQALKEGLEFLQQDDGDFKVRSQIEWVHYDLIKQVSQSWQDYRNKNQRPPGHLQNELLEQLRSYARIKPEIPGMASGKILNILCPMATGLDAFPKILQWFFDQDKTGQLALPPDDWKPNVWNGKTFQSAAVKVARALAGWVKARPDSTSAENFDFALETCEKVHRKAADEDKLWLEWDLTSLHRQAGNFEQAEALLRSVLKAKRSEFWAWAEAGRLYRQSRPRLAMSCFCQAARLGNDPKFVGKVHIELSEMLAELGEHGQASKEAVIAAGIYDEQGWSHPKELQALLAADWYDPSLPHEPPQSFYGLHAERALTLCYDNTETVPANFIGFTEGKDGKKPVPRFAVPDDGGAFSLLGKRALPTDKLKPGHPVEVTVATEGSRRDILDLAKREDGSLWDVIGKEPAVLARVFDEGEQIEIYFDRERHFRVPSAVLVDGVDLYAGMGMIAGIVRVGKKNRPQVAFAEPSELPDIEDFRIVAGEIRRMDAGFGFIQDVFIAPHLLDDFPDELNEAGVMAVVKWNKKREEWGWQAITISQVNKSDTESN